MFDDYDDLIFGDAFYNEDDILDITDSEDADLYTGIDDIEDSSDYYFDIDDKLNEDEDKDEDENEEENPVLRSCCEDFCKKTRTNRSNGNYTRKGY